MVLRFSSDATEMSIEVVHSYLVRSYWSEGITLEVVEAAMRNSVCFAMFDGSDQVGFGRFITDKSTFAYLADVFVLEEYQGRGVGKDMMESAFRMPEVQGLRRMLLATAGAHGLYKKFGFDELERPETMMEKSDLDIYLKRQGGVNENSLD